MHLLPAEHFESMKGLANAAILMASVASLSIVLAYWEQTIAVRGRILCHVVPPEENPMKVVIVDRFTIGPQRELARTSVNETGHFFVQAVARKIPAITPSIEVYHSCFWGDKEWCSVFLVENQSLPCVTRGMGRAYTVCDFTIDLTNTTLETCIIV